MPASPNIMDGQLYPLVSIRRGDEGKFCNMHRMLCVHHGCKEVLFLSPGVRSKLASIGIIKFAKQKGWFADKHGYALCPVHNFTGRKTHPGNKNQKPVQRKAAFLSKRDKEMAAKMAEVRKAPVKDEASIPLIAISPISKDDDMNMQPTKELPRVASRDQKRQIRDFLDSIYDEEKGRYTKDWSDEKAAIKLKLPRIWITTIREDFYGPDENEESILTLEKTRVLLDVAEKLKNDALSIATRAEELERQARKILG